MKLTNAQCAILHSLLGVKITHSKNGHTQIHSKPAGTMGTRLGITLTKRRIIKSPGGLVEVHFQIGEDLGLVVEFAGASQVTLYLGSYQAMDSASLALDRLKLIATEYYEVIDGKVVHSRKRQPEAGRPHGGGGSPEIPSH